MTTTEIVKSKKGVFEVAPPFSSKNFYSGPFAGWAHIFDEPLVKDSSKKTLDNLDLCFTPRQWELRYCVFPSQYPVSGQGLTAQL